MGHTESIKAPGPLDADGEDGRVAGGCAGREWGYSGIDIGFGIGSGASEDPRGKGADVGLLSGDPGLEAVAPVSELRFEDSSRSGESGEYHNG